MKIKFHFIKFTSIDNRQMQMYCSPTFFGIHKHVNVNLQLHTNVCTCKFSMLYNL